MIKKAIFVFVLGLIFVVPTAQASAWQSSTILSQIALLQAQALSLQLQLAKIEAAQTYPQPYFGIYPQPASVISSVFIQPPSPQPTPAPAPVPTPISLPTPSPIPSAQICPFGATKSNLYYSTWHTLAHPAYSDQNNHAVLDGALITTRWSKLEPARGQFDWTTLDQAIAEFTGSTNPSDNTSKKALIGIVPFSLWWPENGNYNSDTPLWVYSTVPAISFAATDAGVNTVTFPKVWDANFYPIYEEFLSALGAHYRNDARVGAIQVGVGFLGTTEMYYGSEADQALAAAGWTLEAWEAHVKKVINLSVRYLAPKPLFIRMTERFKARVFTINNIDTAKRIAEHAAWRGVSVSLGDPNPDWTLADGTSKWYGYQVVNHLGSISGVPGNFSIGIEDDCPFYAPTDSRCVSPKTGKYRDLSEMKRILDMGKTALANIGNKYPLTFFFQRPEVRASNQNDSNFNQDVYNLVLSEICR